MKAREPEWPFAALESYRAWDFTNLLISESHRTFEVLNFICMKMILATHNDHKVAEVRALLPEYNWSSLAELQYERDIPETGSTLAENALIKARTIFEKYKQPVAADDTGLLVEALDGKPGVYSARYAGPEADSEANIAKLLRALDGERSRQAHFKTVIAYIDAAGEEHLFEGRVDGIILRAPAGESGFGYDPVFQPEGHEQSFAQMRAADKNAISHRGRALRAFANFIQQREVQKS